MVVPAHLIGVGLGTLPALRREINRCAERLYGLTREALAVMDAAAPPARADGISSAGEGAKAIRTISFHTGA